MANISNLVIRATPVTLAIGSPLRIEVTYTAIFTPMERLLASYGLQFRESIRLYESDVVWSWEGDEDDFLPPSTFALIPAGNIAGALNNRVNIVRTFTRTVAQLRGPDDEDDQSPYPVDPNSRRIEARIRITPIPINPMNISGDTAISNLIEVNVRELGFEPNS